MSNKPLVIILCSYFLASCGGGGGGGGGGGASPSPSIVTYSYTKNIDISTNGGSWDTKAGVASYRRYSETGSMWRSVGDASMQASISSTGTVTLKLSRDYSFTPDGGNSPLDMSFNYDFSLSSETEVYSIGNILAENMYWLREYYTISDTANLTSRDLTVTMLDFYSDTGPEWLGTDYVSPFLMLMDWGDNCLFCDDTDSDEDLFAGVYGDLTASGDMPSNGLLTYNVRAMAWWNSGTYQSDGSLSHRPALEGNGELQADLSSMKITGSILLDYVFAKESLSLSWPRVEGASAGGVSFSGDISGNSFSGDVQWGGEYGSGSFEGNFFGPDATEMGGWFEASEEDGFDSLIGSFVGCSSSGC